MYTFGISDKALKKSILKKMLKGDIFRCPLMLWTRSVYEVQIYESSLHESSLYESSLYESSLYEDMIDHRSYADN